MPRLKRMTNEEVAKDFRKLNPTVKLISVTTEKKKRGRPKGSKNKPAEEKSNFRYDPEHEYRYWFIADACGCRLGADIIGAGMWCKHKNTMHIEERKAK